MRSISSSRKNDRPPSPAGILQSTPLPSETFISRRLRYQSNGLARAKSSPIHGITERTWWWRGLNLSLRPRKPGLASYAALCSCCRDGFSLLQTHGLHRHNSVWPAEMERISADLREPAHLCLHPDGRHTNRMRRRSSGPRPSSPVPSSSRLDGSGTAVNPVTNPKLLAAVPAPA